MISSVLKKILTPQISRIGNTQLSKRLTKNFAKRTRNDKWFFMKDTSKMMKGMKNYKGDFTKKGTSGKKSRRIKPKPYKMKTVKSFHCRLVLNGPRWDRDFLHKTQGHSHLKRKKSKQSKQKARRLKALKKCDLSRVKKSLPYWKKNRKMRKYEAGVLRL